MLLSPQNTCISDKRSVGANVVWGVHSKMSFMICKVAWGVPLAARPCTNVKHTLGQPVDAKGEGWACGANKQLGVKPGTQDGGSQAAEAEKGKT